MNDAMEIGLIGAGAIAVGAHLPALHRRSDVHVRWVADVNEAAARAAMDDGLRAHWTGDYQRVLADPAVEAVVICTPPALHAQMAIEALQAGKHVLLEKPMALDAAEAATIRAAADRSDCCFMVAENWYFARAIAKARELLQSGTIGEPYLLRCVHDTSFRIVANPADANIGWFTLVGTHVVSVTRWLLGEFRWVFAASPQWSTRATRAIEDDLVISAEIGDTVVGSLSFTGRSRHLGERRITFAVYGNNGLLEFEVWSGLVRLSRNGSQVEEATDRVSRGYDEEIDHFVNCIRGGTKPLPSVADQIRTLEVIDAVYQSMSTKTPQLIPP
jgi:predicted dehydrogenase